MNDTEMSTSGVATAVAAPISEAETDAVLIERYLDGDARAFEMLFKKYQTPIFNVVSRMVNGEDAHDLTQDIFCNALRGLHTFRGESKFSTWLYTIARNVCLNRIRRNSYIQEDSLEAKREDQPGFQLPDPAVDVEAVVETHELQRVVNSVLTTLPPEQRLLMTLRDFEQLSYEEISLVTGMSLSNVKSRLHRARMAFKKRFEPYLRLVKGEG